MLHEVDHVLEFVRERDRRGMNDFLRGVRAAQRAVGISHNRIEDFAVVELRRDSGIEITGEEEARDVTAAVTTRLGDELVHHTGHQNNGDSVRIDIGNMPKRHGIDWIQPRIKDLPQGVEVSRRKAGRWRCGVDIDRDVQAD